MPRNWARVDAVFWSSAIFSRHAMTVNHVSPHKFGDRKGLGVYRIVAAIFMYVLFTFLTVYEQIISHSRFYFTLAWWVSLGTFLFFALSLLPWKAYFGEKRPDAKTASDGPHPFFDWKILSSMNCFLLQASIHLVVLNSVQVYPDPKKYDYVPFLVSLAPVTLLIGDFFANRVYFPLIISFNYSIFAYSMGFLSLMILKEIEETFSMPEFKYFNAPADRTLAWWLPAIISISTYLAMRLKFWYLTEGDLVFDLDSFALRAKRRLDRMEK